MLSCDVCGGQLTMDASGDFAVCEKCGMKYTMERIKAQAQGIDGSIKNDNSNVIGEQIANWEKMARDAFNNSNFSEAYNYYCKILEKNAEDWTATYRKALCMGWQASLENMYANVVIGGINDAYKLLMVDDTLDDSQKSSGALTMATEMLNWITALYTMAVDDYKRRYSVKNDTEWKAHYNVASTICYSLIHTIALFSEFNYENSKDKEGYESIVHKVCDISKAVAKYTVTSIHFKTRDEWDSFLKTYKPHYVDSCPTDDAEIASEKLTNAFNQLLSDFNAWVYNYEKKVDEQLRREKEARIVQYWSEHAAEKAEYDTRLAEIDCEINSLRSQTEKFDAKIAEIKEELSDEIPGNDLLKDIKERQNDLINQKSKLGLFAVKQKKQIQAQIDELQPQINELEEKVNKQKQALEDDVAAKISVIAVEKKTIVDRMNVLVDEKAKIEYELTKDR